MTPKPSTAWDTTPHKAIVYTPVAWFIDRHAGRRDGDAAIPDLPAGPPEATNSGAVTTPFLEVRRRHFLDRSEREHRHMLNTLQPVHHEFAAVRQDIAGLEERVAEFRERLAAIPERLDEAGLTQRNAVEQHIPEVLVRARRQREHDARRATVAAELERALARLRGLRVEEARLTKTITAREQILATRVRQLHEHTLRRCATYRHHLVHKHPDGNALIPLLDLALPTLPDWLPRHDPDTGPNQPPRLVA